jgi:hypothetical protein
MYTEHLLGDRLTLVNAGQFSRQFEGVVSAIKAKLVAANKGKMLTLLISYQHTPVFAINHIWVALSGVGNTHKTSYVRGLLREINDQITFVPYLENAIENRDPPTDPAFDAIDYPDQKRLFNRFLIFATNALKPDGLFDPAVAAVFHLNAELIDHLQVIKQALYKDVFKAEFAKYRCSPASESARLYWKLPIQFLRLVAWECYADDAELQRLKRDVFPAGGAHVNFYDVATRVEIENPNFRVNSLYIAELGLAKGDALFQAFDALWVHLRRFTQESLASKMQHCAETNLIAYLQAPAGKDILKRPGLFYLFSATLTEPGREVSPMCDNCMLKSLPEIAALNVAAGDSPVHVTRATIPVIPGLSTFQGPLHMVSRSARPVVAYSPEMPAQLDSLSRPFHTLTEFERVREGGERFHSMEFGDYE